MMKKYLLLVIIFFAFRVGYAQSLSFTDMQNVTSMSNAQLHDFLVSKGFKQDGTQTIKGKPMEQYKSGRTADKAEVLLVSAPTKTATGISQRSLSYTTLQGADMDNLLAQAKKSTLTLIFQGADVNKNIFRFDNSLFTATIAVSFDKKSGGVDIQQKGGN